MKRIVSTGVIFLAASSTVASAEIESVLEWQGTIHTTNVEEAEKYCVDFPGDSNDIKEFFNQASIVSDIRIPKTRCSAEGVAKNTNGVVVDWWLFQGGVGYVVNKKEKKSYICKKGSRCCELLPHICDTQP